MDVPPLADDPQVPQPLLRLRKFQTTPPPFTELQERQDIVSAPSPEPSLFAFFCPSLHKRARKRLKVKYIILLVGGLERQVI